MPYNLAESYKHLEDCNTDLDQLFTTEDEALEALKALYANIRPQVLDVKKYYRKSCVDAKDIEQMESIIKDYKDFIKHLTNVKKAKYSDTSQNPEKKESFQERFEAINSLKTMDTHRKINVIRANLVKACELIFWISASLTLFASIFAIALPVLIVQPAVGLVLSITIVGFIFKALENLINCLSEFTSFRPHNNEYDREVQLISFFQPKQQEVASLEDGAEIAPEHEPGFCF